jgi:Fe-S cluster assembly iron-binding protein IscA
MSSILTFSEQAKTRLKEIMASEESKEYFRFTNICEIRRMCWNDI